MMGVDLPVVPMLHQYVVTDRVTEIADRIAAGAKELPIIRDPEESWYLRQERDGFIIGPYEKSGRPWAIDGVPADFGMELLPPDLDRVEHILALAMARVPALARGRPQDRGQRPDHLHARRQSANRPRLRSGQCVALDRLQHGRDGSRRRRRISGRLDNRRGTAPRSAGPGSAPLRRLRRSRLPDRQGASRVSACNSAFTILTRNARLGVRGGPRRRSNGSVGKGRCWVPPMAGSARTGLRASRAMGETHLPFDVPAGWKRCGANAARYATRRAALIFPPFPSLKSPARGRLSSLRLSARTGRRPGLAASA